jgi:hypothetical protein
MSDFILLDSAARTGWRCLPGRREYGELVDGRLYEAVGDFCLALEDLHDPWMGILEQLVQ